MRTSASRSSARDRVTHEGRPVGFLSRDRLTAGLQELTLLEAQPARPHRVPRRRGGAAKRLHHDGRIPGRARQSHQLALDEAVFGRERQGPCQQGQRLNGVFALPLQQRGSLTQESHPRGVVGRARQPQLTQADQRLPVSGRLVGARQRLGGDTRLLSISSRARAPFWAAAWAGFTSSARA